ncbi:MAG: NAD(P)H-hydrate epimerase [Candidatus Thorarchaeota archaeon]
MGLPGLTASQMLEVDRIMIDELGIPVDLMMEHAGNNLARLCVELSPMRDGVFQVIVGSGNNGGGGIVAARRLKSWGHNVIIYLPRGKDNLRSVPLEQLKRAEKVGVKLVNSLPEASTDQPYLVVDAYLGYGYRKRKDTISEAVFSYLRSESKVVSLDVPSGLDSSTGESHSLFNPIATMSIAFMKSGLLSVPRNLTGTLYIADIGVPMDIYETKLNLSWKPPFSLFSLNSLYLAFSTNSLQQVKASKNEKELSWSV